jgi:hypothetical protein
VNTFRRFSLPLTLVGVVATCVLSAGAASARVPPVEPNLTPTTASSVPAHPDSAADDRARQLLAHTSYVELGQDELAEQAAAAARSRAAEEHPGAGLGTLVVDPNESTARDSTSNKPSAQSGDGVDIAVLGVTALAGLALGAAGSTASRRLRNRYGLAA